MTAPEFDPFDRGKSESENLLTVAGGNANSSSLSSAEVIDSEGSVLGRAKMRTNSDTATNNSYPDLMVEDKVARGAKARISNTASTISLTSPALMDSDVQVVREAFNSITSSLAPSCLFSRKGDMAARLDEPNDYTVKAMVASIIAAQSVISDTSATVGTADPRTELDTHANMCVLGRHAYIFEKSGKTCNVNPFMDGLGVAKDVPIVDGAIAYDCPYSRNTYILLVRNALSIPSMENNLIPPFIMREGGVIVNDVPKFQCKDPSVEDHAITFETCDLRIPMQLHGTFSYFHTRTPTSEELHHCDKVFLCPDASDWNPHCLSFEMNERAMLSYEGELNRLDRRLNLDMKIDHNDGSEVFDIAGVSVEAWEKQVDSNISSSYAASDDPLPDTYDLDNHFAEALNL